VVVEVEAVVAEVGLAALQRGTYTITVMASASGFQPQTTNVTLTVK
jgi:hypothetical protein